MDSPLVVELQTYDQHRNELLAGHENEYVLIFKREVAGFFQTEADGVRAGYRAFENVPFLVKRITRVEHPELFVSNLIA